MFAVFSLPGILKENTSILLHIAEGKTANSGGDASSFQRGAVASLLSAGDLLSSVSVSPTLKPLTNYLP